MDSVTFWLAQLQLDCTTDGPITRLPNELVDSILSRLDMQELIHLQVVCKKWKAVIYSIGQTKKSLSVGKCDNSSYDVDFLKKRSIGLIDLNSFTHIKVTPFLNFEHLPSQLVKLFPNIESIAINLPLSDIIAVLPQLQLKQLTTLSFTFSHDTSSSVNIIKLLLLINLCDSLKRLYIRSQTYFQKSLLSPTLARLEQFFYSSFDLSLVRYFGPNCTRVSLNIYYCDDDVTQWHTINGRWLANVTHLELKASELDLLIDYFSKHAFSLQVLRLEGSGNCIWNCTRLTSQMIGHLSKLKHLTEIELSDILFDLPHLEEAARKFELVPLVSIRTFTLSPCKFTGLNDCDQLTSILCTILPTVEHLNLTMTNYNCKLVDFEQYLDRFSKLRSHSFY